MFSAIFLQLTLRDVLTDIPHDASAITVYLMLALFLGFVWLGSREQPKHGEDA